MPEWDALLPEVGEFTKRNKDAYIGLVRDLIGELNRVGSCWLPGC
jgi:hypothetical protein